MRVVGAALWPEPGGAERDSTIGDRVSYVPSQRQHDLRRESA